ncbi:MAG: OmpA family protein [Reichenbachiella sp.]
MRKLILPLLFLLLGSKVTAQETIKWASEVMFVTSETSHLQYAASQVLHGPNVYPSGGESPNAWRPARPDGDEYIVIRFDEPIRAQQIAIAETENPGAVSKVFAYDSLDNEYLLFDLTPRPIPLESRLLNLFFEKTPYRVSYIRIDLASASVPGFNSIDAIGLSTSNIPISVLIELAANVNNNLSTEKLSENVNSDYREIGPLLSPDGKTLYFSRANHPENLGGIDDNSDIWYSELDEETQEWLPAQNMGPPLNTTGPNWIESITQDGEEVVLLLGNTYEKRGRMGVGVSMTRSKGPGKWEKPETQFIENDYNYSDNVDYYMSRDTEVLISSVERDETNGDQDLYVSFKNHESGSWSEPLNLGPVINSADREYAPFLDKDNETLYFSSKGFRGYGDADIFVSKRLDESWTNWSQPENMGRGVNGPDEDTYFNIPASGSHAYFTRGVANENTDVYRFRIDELFIEPGQEQPVIAAVVEPIVEEPVIVAVVPIVEEEPVAVVEEPEPVVAVEPEPEPIIVAAAVPVVVVAPVVVPEEEVVITIKGQVFNSETNATMSCKIVVERLPDGVKIGETYTDDAGLFEFKVRPGARYGFMADKDGFLAKNENVDLNDVTESMSLVTDLYLNPIRKGAHVVMNNIFFEFDQSDLKTASYSELERILDLLNAGNISKIEIGGYSDSIGDDDYNTRLSQRRANSVYKYFINHGIESDRMISVGYGEADPIASNNTVENRKLNRRVEFKILE